MPPYGFLANTIIDGKHIQNVVATNRMAGVPYSDEMVETAQADFTRSGRSAG